MVKLSKIMKDKNIAMTTRIKIIKATAFIMVKYVCGGSGLFKNVLGDRIRNNAFIL